MIVIIVAIISLIFLFVGWFLRGVKDIADNVKEKKNHFGKATAELVEWKSSKEKEEKKQEEILKHYLQK